MRFSKFFFFPLFLVVAISLAACKPGTGGRADKPDPDLALIKAPVVGDIYAAELSNFSVAHFSSRGDDATGKIYGLMKVVAVDADKVVVITENAGSEDRAISRQDIKGDLKDITFDEREKIDVVRGQLEKAYESGAIYEVRRGS